MQTAHIHSIEFRVQLDPEYAKSFSLKPLIESIENHAAAYELVPDIKPPTARKTLANGDFVEIRRTIVEGVHYVVACYLGPLSDLGEARFALDNTFHDLAVVGLLPFPVSVAFSTTLPTRKEAA